jgi:hypothetical protein
VLLTKACDLLDIIDGFKTKDEARAVLRAFIHVRRRYNPIYGKLAAETDAVTPDRLIAIIESFASADSEGGKRAQAVVVAGLMDLFDGAERVATTRVNDPDRQIRGDVGVYVRDKKCSRRATNPRARPTTIFRKRLSRLRSVRPPSSQSLAINRPSIFFKLGTGLLLMAQPLPFSRMDAFRAPGFLLVRDPPARGGQDGADADL